MLDTKAYHYNIKKHVYAMKTVQPKVKVDARFKQSGLIFNVLGNFLL